MDLLNLFWLFLIISSIAPLFRQKIIETNRLQLMRKIEEKRGSRVIALIHRQESMSFLGFPLARYIDIDDSEQVLRAIKMTDDNVPIDLILHTPGGLVLAAEQIANALSKHPAKVTVFVPHYAMSGGTLLALAADEIVMDENAVLGPVDPQLGNYPAASILKVLETKDRNQIDDQTLILADISQKAIQQVKATVKRIACCHYPPEVAERLAEELATGRWTHDYPITVEEARELGLNVSTDMPPEIYQLMNLYPQTLQRRPSVEYIPMPYPARPGVPGRAPQQGNHQG
ncbi:SDH family Clp fold serine proteinase [Thermanaerothrix sp.]|jgi:ClpP class serine protease|uniref:SDH family Clp fold serine proteinase n=1 Tax=Thermanaerothrix sp. TaxID=2972675 RepID=UPI002ADE2556|nr:ATP-dependent Clp protease proteolytic subunit [Thermanaerothrix sp.]